MGEHLYAELLINGLLNICIVWVFLVMIKQKLKCEFSECLNRHAFRGVFIILAKYKYKFEYYMLLKVKLQK